MGANLILPAGSAAASTTADPVTRSLRFNGSNSRLSNTFSSNGDRKMWTLSFWAKGNFTGTALASSVPNSSFGQYYSVVKVLAFSANISFQFTEQYGSNVQTNVTAAHSSNGELRDPSSWYHWTVHYDSAESSQTDRVRAYLNGKRLTLSFAGYTLGQNRDGNINRQSFPHSIGGWDYAYNGSTNISPYKDYMADYYFVDGANVDPVGNFIEDNGWGGYKPKAYDMSSHSGNSFHLKFEDSSDIGADSANSNDFTATNLASHDVMLDTPTKNYATLNPLSKSSGGSLAEGNLKVPFGGTYPSNVLGSIGVSSGKWYWEVYLEGGSSANGHACGVAVPEWANKNSDPASASTPYAHYVDSRSIFVNSGSSTSNSTSFSAQDIIGVALNADDDEISFYKNGSIIGSAQSLEANQTWMPFHKNSSYTSLTQWVNYGADPTFAGNYTGTPDSAEWAHTPPAGYKSLNTSNLDDPTIKPHEHFDILTYTGNSDLYNGSGSTQNVTGVNFDVGMAWIKDRDNRATSSYTNSSYDEYGHYLFDTVTGTSSGGYNLDADVVSSGSGTTLNSGYYGVTSFSAGSGTNRGITVDQAGETNFDYDDGYSALTERYVAWLWKLGSTGSSSTWNSSYTAPSTEHYNASAGVTTIEVSPVSSGNLEVAHSLSAAPEFFFVGTDSYGDFSGYPAFHKDLDSGKYLQLDGTSAQSSNSNYFPSGAAHADYIKLGSVFADSYSYGNNLRIWAFTGVEGFSKIGSYRGAGNNGVFVYTGHRPKMVWIKNMDTTGNWFIFDAVRDTYNETVNYLRPNSSASETTNSAYKIDVLSNGFKIYVESTHMNNSAYDYVFCSFAESPFKHANAR